MSLGAVLGAEVTLSAVFMAGMLFALQHLSDRYSPLVARAALTWSGPFFAPTLGQLTMLILSVVLYGHLETAVRPWMVLIDIAGVAFGVAIPFFFTLDPGNAVCLLRHLSDKQQEQAYSDMLSAGFGRRDQQVVDRVMESLQGSQHAVPIIHWAAQDPGFIATDWGFQAIASSAIGSIAHSATSLDTFDVAKELFTRAVDQRRWGVGLWFIDSLVDMASSSNVLGRVHLCELFVAAGNILWLTDDYAIRKVVGGSRLEELQSLYLVRTIHFAHDLAKTKDAPAMEMLIGGMSRIMFDAGRSERDHFVNKIYDAMRIALEGDVLTQQALLEFSSYLGNLRRGETESQDREWLDWNLIQIAAHFVQIGGSDEDTSHLLRNGRIQPGARIKAYAEPGVDETSYHHAADLGGIRLTLN